MLSRLVAATVVAFTLAFGLAPAHGQERYPSKPIRIVVPFAAGGASDIMARIVGQKMGETLGQTMLVEPKPGAGGNLGSDFVAKAAPDGYTLLVATASSHGANPALYKKFPYDPVNDFIPIGVFGINPSAFGIHPSVPATDVQSLIKLIRENPGKYSFGSGGVGSILHLCGEQFRVLAGNLDIVHVPYRGSAPMMNDLAAGQLPMAFDVLPTILPQIQAGKVRAIANGAGIRSSQLPDVPTVQEQGVAGYECYSWGILFAPAKTPAPIVETLHAALAKALVDPAVIKRLQETGMEVFQPPYTLQQSAAFIRTEVAKWAEIVRKSGVQQLD